MNRWSRAFVALEMAALAAPATAGLWLLTPMYLTPSAGDYFPYEASLHASYLLSVLALAAGWYLAIGFIWAGRQALLAAPLRIWIAALFGLLPVTLGYYLRRQSEPTGSSAYWHFWSDGVFFWTGCVLLIPLLHLGLERLFARRSNNRLERP